METLIYSAERVYCVYPDSGSNVFLYGLAIKGKTISKITRESGNCYNFSKNSFSTRSYTHFNLNTCIVLPEASFGWILEGTLNISYPKQIK